MKLQASILKRLLLCASVPLCLCDIALSQTAGQWTIQRRKASGNGYTQMSATPVVGEFAKVDSSGNLTFGAVATTWGDLTGTPTTLAGYGITDAQPLDADLTSIASAGLSSTGASGDAGKVAIRATSGTLLATSGFATSETAGVTRSVLNPVNLFFTNSSNLYGAFGSATITGSSKLWTGPNASGTIVTTGNLTDITATGTVTSGTWSGSFGAVTGANLTSVVGYGLKSATTTVSVSGATAPSSGQVLTATGTTAATWQTPSGGSAISDPSVAYVRSDGNNGTAAIGNPALPYLTIQAAYDAGARTLDIGVGTFSTLSVSTTTTLRIRGRGNSATIMGAITVSGNVTFTLVDIGVKSVSVASIEGSSATSVTAPSLVVENVHSAGAVTTTQTSVGGSGSIAVSGDFSIGGNVTTSTNVAVTAGNISIGGRGAIAGDITTDGVAGGDANDDDPGGGGQTAGNVTLAGVVAITGNISANAGAGGASSGAQIAGDGGTGGTISLDGNVSVAGNISMAGGAGGADGGMGGGNPGAGGTLTMKAGARVDGTLTPDAATVQGAIIAGIFYPGPYTP